MFDRGRERSGLTAFVADGGPEAAMAVVSRRRPGKPFLLGSLARAADGFRSCAREAIEAESLRRFGEEFGPYRANPAPMRFDRWEQAVDVSYGTVAEQAERTGHETGAVVRDAVGQARQGGGPLSLRPGSSSAPTVPCTWRPPCSARSP
ncbi:MULTISPECIES: hypothetical protein [unclassified Streptomyces]|uniref:hypothetical protein n=1 Tax=unclassified Streptomyces TaxID=2593676 RepID=UPI0015C47B52|nr:hypothetical protein [Streptomyces sp. 13-12-16]